MPTYTVTLTRTDGSIARHAVTGDKELRQFLIIALTVLLPGETVGYTVGA